MIEYCVILPNRHSWFHISNGVELDKILNLDEVKQFQPQQVKVTFEYIGKS